MREAGFSAGQAGRHGIAGRSSIRVVDLAAEGAPDRFHGFRRSGFIQCDTQGIGVHNPEVDFLKHCAGYDGVPLGSHIHRNGVEIMGVADFETELGKTGG